ncbi:MAG: DoxX family protein [Balneolaceae bacterium]
MILEKKYEEVDFAITNWMAKYGLLIMRVGLGIIFLWFGALKYFPGLSPAEELVKNTVYFVDPAFFIPVLATWEVLIGVGLIAGKYMRTTLLLLFLQMPGTALPLLVMPDIIWETFPFGLSLEGQYIIKNLVLVSAGLVLGATVRGGKLVSESTSN